MIYKSFKFTNNESGNEIKVRFYFTGIYTIVDKNGEHEMGEWLKKPLLVGKYDMPSKDKHCVEYRARPFDCAKAYHDTSMADVAKAIARHAIFMKQVAI